MTVRTDTEQRKYAYELEVRDAACTRVLARGPLPMAKLREHAAFEARCRGYAAPEGAEPEVVERPRFLEGDASRYLTSVGLEVRNGTRGAPLTKEYGTTVFATQARALAQDLVRTGALAAGSHYTYLVSAAPEAPRSGLGSLAGAVRNLQPPIRARSREELGIGGVVQDAPFDVYLPRHVLKEAEQWAEAGGNNEQAGFLLGCLGQDGGRVFLAVTAQAHAAGEGTCTSFRFTEDAGVAARRLLAARGRGECVVGWWHSHFWCATCPKRKECAVSTVFFSADDEAVMESGHAEPWQVALVVGFDGRETGYAAKLYGWLDGGVRERPFEIVDGPIEAD